MTQPVLEIEDLHLSFPGYKADVHALNHVSLRIDRGEIVGVVGESGSGKSVTAMLAMRLLPEGSYHIHQGRVSLLGEDVLNASEKQMRKWRGARVSMIFRGANDGAESHPAHWATNGGSHSPSSGGEPPGGAGESHRPAGRDANSRCGAGYGAISV